MTRITLPDSNKIEHTYRGTSTTTTDQVGRRIKREADSLGRLVKVIELDASGNLTRRAWRRWSHVQARAL